MTGESAATAKQQSEKRLSARLERFVKDAHWVFAKTYAETWPHHYIVKERVDQDLFLDLVRHIRACGYMGWFYRTPITYFDHDGYVYWTMVPPEGHPRWYPPEQETIVNRCPANATYEARRRAGTLPESRQ